MLLILVSRAFNLRCYRRLKTQTGDCTKADDAERYVIEELRKMGSDALHCWADKAAQHTVETLRQQQPKLHSNGKKKSVGTRPSE